MLRKTGAVPFLLAPSLGIIVFPFLLVAILFNELVRFLVSQLIFLFHGNKVEICGDGADGFWRYKKTGSSRNVLTYIMTPLGSLDADKIAKFYRDHIQLFRDAGGKRPYKKYEKVMTTSFGYSCWKSQEPFNVYNHIRELSWNKVHTPSDLRNLLTELASDMDETKPQWELIIVPKYEDEFGHRKSILLCRFLHAYMDGLSFMILFKEHITPEMEYTIDPLKFSIPFWRKALFYLSTLIYGPFFLATLSVERFFLTPWITRDRNSTWKSVKTDRKKLFTWANPSNPITDESIKKIRFHRDMKASVTNVITTAFASAAAKTLPSNRLVKEFIISELVAYLPYPDPNPQNRFAYYNFPVSAEREDFWVKLSRCKRDSRKSMMGPDVLSTFYFFKLAGRFPAWMSPFWLHGANSSLVLSNAPFSRKRVCLRDGTEILEMGGFTPQPNDMGLSITSTRYGEEVKIFACADSSWMSEEELRQLVDQIPLEIERMSREVDAANNNQEEQVGMKTMKSAISNGNVRESEKGKRVKVKRIVDQEDGLNL